MPEYPSAKALIADAHLRMELWPDPLGVIVVEGPDDNRLFQRRVHHPAQIIVAGGRRLLLAAFEITQPYDRDSILFITDCDYAVRRGDLSGGHGLAITAHTNVEADLLALGLLESVVQEIVPSVVGRQNPARVSEAVLDMARSLAVPLGRIRMAAEPLGVDLGFDSIDLSKYWFRKERTADVAKLKRVISDKLNANGVSRLDWESRLADTPEDPDICNGKDLIRATRLILNYYYGLDREVTETILTRMIRIAMTEDAFSRWPVVQRIRTWEVRTERVVLR
ncbi:hypothetical protein [Micromonospora sp. BL4]|uniref:hypothetical protein n=1 Tax=Micromonospora sp. BL4 TaxID=2478710 RepID=UPI0011C36874|nr:hypothetical protein [Micromonospora sp. BL4]